MVGGKGQVEGKGQAGCKGQVGGEGQMGGMWEAGRHVVHYFRGCCYWVVAHLQLALTLHLLQLPKSRKSEVGALTKAINAAAGYFD